jgi:hypothetical protein
MLINDALVTKYTYHWLSLKGKLSPQKKRKKKKEN